MVLWCRECGAYVGLVEPVSDWTINRDSLCLACAKKRPEFAVDLIGVIIKDEHKQEQVKVTEQSLPR